MIITRNKIICKIKTNSLSIQGNATKKNGLSATFSGTKATISVSGASHNHGGYTGYIQPTFSGTEGDISVTGGNHGHPIYSTTNGSSPKTGKVISRGCDDETSVTNAGAIRDSGNLSMSGKFTPKGTVENHRHTISNSGTLSMSGDYTPAGSVTVGAGDSETRPDNYSYVIWKRIA